MPYASHTLGSRYPDMRPARAWVGQGIPLGPTFVPHNSAADRSALFLFVGVLATMAGQTSRAVPHRQALTSRWGRHGLPFRSDRGAVRAIDAS